jgi:hypothetical protein
MDLPRVPAGTASSASRRRRSARRPRAIWLVAGLLLLQGLLEIVVGLLAWYARAEVDGPIMNTWQHALAGLPVVLGIGLLAVAVGLWQLRPWAWLVAMSLQGIGLAQALTMYLRGDPDYWSMALSAIVVLALNQAEVREAFGSADA